MPRTLLPCPFCGGGETIVYEHRLNPTMRGPGAVITVTVRHWCGKHSGIVASHTEFRGRTEEDAIAAWNTRIQAQESK